MIVWCRRCPETFDSLDDFDAHVCDEMVTPLVVPPPHEPTDATVWPEHEPTTRRHAAAG
jgi:hypothetical protein